MREIEAEVRVAGGGILAMEEGACVSPEPTVCVEWSRSGLGIHLVSVLNEYTSPTPTSHWLPHTTPMKKSRLKQPQTNKKIYMKPWQKPGESASSWYHSFLFLHPLLLLLQFLPLPVFFPSFFPLPPLLLLMMMVMMTMTTMMMMSRMTMTMTMRCK